MQEVDDTAARQRVRGRSRGRAGLDRAASTALGCFVAARAATEPSGGGLGRRRDAGPVATIGRDDVPAVVHTQPGQEGDAHAALLYAPTPALVRRAALLTASRRADVDSQMYT